MGSRDDLRSDKGRFTAEDVGIDFFQRIAADVIVAVACRWCEMRVRYFVLSVAFEHPPLISFTDFINCFVDLCDVGFSLHRRFL